MTVCSLGHDIVDLAGQILASVGVQLLDELHKDLVAPFLLELVFVNFRDTVYNGVDELDLGLLAFAVFIETVLDYVVSEVTFNHLV